MSKIDLIQNGAKTCSCSSLGTLKLTFWLTGSPVTNSLYCQTCLLIDSCHSHILKITSVFNLYSHMF